MRYVRLLVVALLLAVLVPIAAVRPAHAIGGVCYFSDWNNTWYYDTTVEVTNTVDDQGVGDFNVHFSITSYRYSDGTNCWRYYTWEVWNDAVPNGPNEIATIIVGGRVWACGNYVGTYWVGVSGAATGAVSSPAVNYGPTPCGAQVDDFRSYETPYYSQNWTIWPDTYTSVSPNWYTHIG